MLMSRSVGASTAYYLTRPGATDDKTVVILEAKDVASGASEKMSFTNKISIDDRCCNQLDGTADIVPLSHSPLCPN